MQNDAQFYLNLPLHKISVSQLLRNEESFCDVPGDWHIVITDIKNSTRAVMDGKHQLVNLVATGSIISTVNIARKEKTMLPFFFGGDGATLLVPGTLRDEVLVALIEHQKNTQENFQLDLRVGCMKVSEVYKQNQLLKIAKVELEEGLDIPIVLGNGLRYAEEIIKNEKYEADLPQSDLSILNLQGMECRWDKIEPPEKRLEVVCLLVDVKEEKFQRPVFQKVLEAIDQIYGPQQNRNPISTQQLNLDASFQKISTEMRVKFGRFKLFYLLKNWLLTALAKTYFVVNERGKRYLKQLVEWSDTLVIDGRINTVITGNLKQREKLMAVLDQMEKEGDLIYGIFVSPESVMSCYIRRQDNQHIHFVDGSEGGYTMAAGMLKEKLRQRK